MKIPILEIFLLLFLVFWLYKTKIFVSIVLDNQNKQELNNISADNLSSNEFLEDSQQCGYGLKSISFSEEVKKPSSVAYHNPTNFSRRFQINSKKREKINILGENSRGSSEGGKSKKNLRSFRKISRNFKDNPDINTLFSEISDGLVKAKGDKLKALEITLNRLEEIYRVPALNESLFYREFFKTSYLTAYRGFPCYKKQSKSKIKLLELWQMMEGVIVKLGEKNITSQNNEFINYFLQSADHYMNFLNEGERINELNFDQIFQFWQLFYSYYLPVMFQTFVNEDEKNLTKKMNFYLQHAETFVSEWRAR